MFSAAVSLVQQFFPRGVCGPDGGAMATDYGVSPCNHLHVHVYVILLRESTNAYYVHVLYTCYVLVAGQTQID